MNSCVCDTAGSNAINVEQKSRQSIDWTDVEKQLARHVIFLTLTDCRCRVFHGVFLNLRPEGADGIQPKGKLALRAPPWVSRIGIDVP